MHFIVVLHGWVIWLMFVLLKSVSIRCDFLDAEWILYEAIHKNWMLTENLFSSLSVFFIYLKLLFCFVLVSVAWLK